MGWNDRINPELLILVPVLYCLGWVLKKSKIEDRKIPVLLGIVAIILSAVWIIATVEIATWRDALMAIFTAMTQGILAAGSAVYMNQLYKQSKKKK